ncbi:hypothetical protein AK812_SmicGene11914 [Symbiodinium microadriaticum]|uniref:Uncharacterized protein n=1 Tax=Symbiodinium microadriaticum TaxID=2951 RepID=A0A1Q9EC12_SYMMI|nr:hypothetical protein AK812_SmicGene11914 [Symbiodinium microadriaticum]
MKASTWTYGYKLSLRREANEKVALWFTRGDFVYEVYEQVLDWPTESQDEYVWAIQRVVEHRLRTLEWWADVLDLEAPDKGRVLTSGAAVHGEACEDDAGTERQETEGQFWYEKGRLPASSPAAILRQFVVLRSVCDADVLLDDNFQIVGDNTRLRRVLATPTDLQGVKFTDLLDQEGKTQFEKFVRKSCSGLASE